MFLGYDFFHSFCFAAEKRLSAWMFDVLGRCVIIKGCMSLSEQHAVDIIFDHGTWIMQGSIVSTYYISMGE